MLQYKKLSGKAIAPQQATEKAAGYDLCSAHDAIVPMKGRCLVKTDIAVSVPKGTYGRVAPRSGLTLKNGIDVGAGVIDEDYRGNVGVILFNHSDTDFVVKTGDRIAQLILEKIELVPTQEVFEIGDLGETQRGSHGFGSTGLHQQQKQEVEVCKSEKGCECCSCNVMRLKLAYDSGC